MAAQLVAGQVDGATKSPGADEVPPSIVAVGAVEVVDDVDDVVALVARAAGRGEGDNIVEAYEVACEVVAVDAVAGGLVSYVVGD